MGIIFICFDNMLTSKITGQGNAPFENIFVCELLTNISVGPILLRKRLPIESKDANSMAENLQHSVNKSMIVDAFFGANRGPIICWAPKTQQQTAC